MNNKDYFDKVLKSAIDDSLSNVETSRDIFNEAWNKKEQGVSKKNYFSIKYMKKTVLIPACCAMLAIVGVFTFSPGARVVAQEVFRTIFISDESGNIVERSEDEKIPVGVGGTPITDENKKDLERKFGFEINFPEKIGDYSYEKVEDYVYKPSVLIMAYDVKYKDSDDIQDKLKKAIDDDKTFEELNKDYRVSVIPVLAYEDNQGHKFQLSLFKYNENSKKHDEDNEKEVNIDGIKCRISEGENVKYNVKKDDEGNGVTDLEHKPINTEERYDIEWNYDGVRYCLYIGKNSSDVDAAIQFTEEYIKILKQK